MKNLGDLGDILFDQLQRIQNQDLEGENFQMEIERSKAITGIASQIIQAGNLSMAAMKFAAEYGVEGCQPAIGVLNSGLVTAKK